MLVQYHSELESNRINKRLHKLEDPIGQLHEDIPTLLKIIYNHIQKDNIDLKIILNEELYEKYSRALAVLESKNLIKGMNTLGRKFAHDFRLIDPIFVLYMCSLFEDTKKIEKLTKKLENCTRGDSINGNSLQKELDVPLGIIYSFFEIYESKGFGSFSREIGVPIIYTALN